MTRHFHTSTHQRRNADPRHGDSGRRIAIPCPHCGGALRTRSNRVVSGLTRQLHLVCIAETCSATFGAYLEITHQVSPGARPNPAVALRTSPPRRSANDGGPPRSTAPGGSEVPPPPANDDADPLTAIG